MAGSCAGPAGHGRRPRRSRTRRRARSRARRRRWCRSVRCSSTACPSRSRTGRSRRSAPTTRRCSSLGALDRGARHRHRRSASWRCAGARAAAYALTVRHRAARRVRRADPARADAGEAAADDRRDGACRSPCCGTSRHGRPGTTPGSSPDGAQPTATDHGRRPATVRRRGDRDRVGGGARRRRRTDAAAALRRERRAQRHRAAGAESTQRRRCPPTSSCPSRDSRPFVTPNRRLLPHRHRARWSRRCRRTRGG